MKTRTLRRRVQQLEDVGKTREAVALIETEALATNIFSSPAGVLTVPDFSRQMAALRVGLELLKKHGVPTIPAREIVN